VRLDEAKVLVTGGSSGIGRETARLLVESGAGVVICGRRQEPLDSAAAEIGATAVRADVSNPGDVERLVAKTIETLGGYNVLVNNAAFGSFGTLVDIDLDAFKRLLDTNVTGAMLVARESAKHFVEQNTGNIVNIASTAALRGFAGGSAYVASKFALSGMTECWRAELRKHNVRVTQINPSEVQTGFAANAGYDQKPSERKLFGEDIAHAIVSCLEMHDRGFVTDATIFATNPEG